MQSKCALITNHFGQIKRKYEKSDSSSDIYTFNIQKYSPFRNLNETIKILEVIYPAGVNKSI